MATAIIHMKSSCVPVEEDVKRYNYNDYTPDIVLILGRIWAFFIWEVKYMPSAKILEQKQQLVANLAEKMKNAKSGVIVDYCGITVEKDTVLRAELRKAGVDYTVIKNTYIKKAADIAGIEGFEPYLEGMTAFAFSNEDPLAPAKILCKFAEENETFNVKVGMMDGAIMSAEEVIELSKIPSKEVLIGKILGSIQSSLYGLAYVLQAKIDKEGGAAEAAE